MERILIIEDELPMRTALEDILAREGYRVMAVADGESGLKRAVEEVPDLILLDIMMPRLDGFAVCAELRRQSSPAAILMLTAKGLLEDRVTGLDAGADDYLVKPFSTRELLARTRALLRRARRQSCSRRNSNSATWRLTWPASPPRAAASRCISPPRSLPCSG